MGAVGRKRRIWVLAVSTIVPLLALVFATLGRAYPKTGGPYVYARKAFGDFIGFQTAWSYWINAWVGNAAIAIAFAGYLTVFWGDASKNWIAVVVAISLIWILTFANILGVREAGAIQVVTTVLKFVPLLVIGIVGLFFGPIVLSVAWAVMVAWVQGGDTVARDNHSR